MGTPTDSLTPLKNVIAGLLCDGTLPFHPDDAHIWEVWGEVVGTAISGHAHPSGIQRGLLRVTVTDPIWLQELKFLEESMRDRLNEKLGRKAINRIEFRVGPK
jgi:predicted nucleic acid-binding Zn ribbon protein